MDKIIKLLLIWATFLTMVACTKVTSNEGTYNLFTEKLDSIQLGEPVLLSFDNGNSANVVSWTVTPNDSIAIEKAGAYATFYFTTPGTYTVLASANSKQASYEVKVINKTYNNTGSSFGITASKIVGVSLNQLVYFKVNNAISNNIIWSASGGNAFINRAVDNRSAYISFSSGTACTINVSDSFNAQSRTIWIEDSTANPSVVTVPFIFSDKLLITPSVSTDSSGNKSLILSTKTTYNYQSNTDQIINLTTAKNGHYTVSFGGVNMAAKPQANALPATCINMFQNMTAGTYPFTVDYGNETLSGSITLSQAGVFTFNWVANNYVSIYPLTVQ